MAMSFIYTRCENPLKCARVTKTMARLQTELHRAGLADQVRLCLVSYDPEYDTPARMTEYAMKLGYRLDSQNLMIQLEPRARDRFFEKLNVAVNFNSSGVNVHGIQLMLFGRAGRFARAYHTLIWDNAQVLADLERLAGEENTAAEVD
jgi:protein SCO1/2